MPEGHVSHHNAQRFTRCLVGRTITEAWSSDPRVGHLRLGRRLAGETITAAEARGKVHLLRFASGRVLVSHLMMSGRWRLLEESAPLPPGRVVLGVRVPGYTALLVRCPTVRLLEPGEPLPTLVSAVGPDLLDPSVDPGAALRDGLARVAATRQIGEVLMDQRVVSGIGNVYKSEALFLAGIDPWRPVGALAPAEAAGLGRIARDLLAAGVRWRGPISTWDPPGWTAAQGPSGQNWVYGRARRPCRRCGAPILARGQGDTHRTTFWCPACQR